MKFILHFLIRTTEPTRYAMNSLYTKHHLRCIYTKANISIFNNDHTPVIYKLAANTMSRLIALEAISIFLQRAELPIMAAAFLNSRHVSSNLTMVLTIRPSGTSVSSHMSANGVPCKEE